MHKDKWNQRYCGRELLWPREPSTILKKETAECPLGRALDLAAGEGRNSFFLARQGWEVTAVDFFGVLRRAAAALRPQGGPAGSGP
jgi:2-polyprenyl-3-methyl-5-hydroxy-6-metoxy-1,4-benzoquinol methylase